MKIGIQSSPRQCDPIAPFLPNLILDNGIKKTGRDKAANSLKKAYTDLGNADDSVITC